MPNIVASGQITLVDLNDAKSLSGYINSNQPKIQIYNPNDSSVLPDWTKSPYVVLTPELYVTGTASNIIAQAKSVTWYANGAIITSGTGGYTIASSGAKALTINQNKLSDVLPQISYTCEIVWTDMTFNADISVKAEINFARVNSGSKGDTGAVGAAAITAVLSNESHVFPAATDGTVTVFGGASTTLSIFEGATDVTGSWTITQVRTGTGLVVTEAVSSKTATVTGIGASTDTASITFTATRTGYSSITKTFTLTKSKTGATGSTGGVGQSATSYWLTVDTKTMVRSSTNSAILSPGTINISLLSQVGTGTPGLYAGRVSIEEHNGTSWSTVTQSAVNTTPAPNNFQTNNATGAIVYTPSTTAKQIRVRMYATGSTVTVGTGYYDEEIVQVLSDNASVAGVLSNDNQAVPTLQDGTGGDFAVGKVQTIMSIYVGATDDSANWTYTLANATGVTAAFAGSTAGTVAARTVNVTALTVDSGTVTITAKRTGFSDVVKIFTVSKNKQGIASTAYWLVNSVSAIGKSIANVYNPATVTISSRMQSGTATVAAYTGRIVVEESTDRGATWRTALYDADASTYTYTPTPQATAAINLTRVSLYVAGAKTTLLDQETIAFVSDGATGAGGAAGVNAVIAYVWAPNGNIVKNSTGSVTAQCDVYDGVTAKTASAYKWYKFVSGSYIQLTAETNYGCTGYTTATLTIPAGAVESMSSFKCIATYNSKDYADVVTIVDQSDPIQVVPISAEGTVFRNGEGTKHITAKVYQAGVEIDTNGTVYEYRWFLRKEDGTIDTTFVDAGKTYKTGKTLTVGSGDVTNIGNLVLELWTK